MLKNFFSNIGGSVDSNNPNQEVQFRKYTVWLWGGFLSVIAFIIFLFMGISWGIFGPLPTFVELESPKSELASEVYASDGSLLGKFFIVDRTNASYSQLPKHVVDALVATEDARFYEHSGIDFIGIARVFYKTILLGQDAGGGSTITQQLAKNLFHEKPSNVWERFKQKLKEWIIALRLERSYTKEEIIQMYLNTVPFSGTTHGIQTASQLYFSTPPDSLNMQQGAVLVGMLKGNTIYNPKRNPKRSEERRNTVLGQMLKYEKIDQATHDSIIKLPLELKYNEVDYSGGLAPYFREYVKAELKRWFKNNVKIDGSSYDIYRDGLKIYTTIDPKMQVYAEQAVSEQMQDLQRQFNEHWKGRVPWEDVPNANLAKTDVWYGTNDLVYRAIKNSERYAELKEQGLTEADIKTSFNKRIKMRLFKWKNESDIRAELKQQGLSDKQIKNALTSYLPRADYTWQGEMDTLMSPIDSIKYVKNLLHTGFIATDPATGYVLAWVGGIDYRYFKYDNARPSSKRQVGSTFKPFVYTVAIENGWSPCRKVPNLPVTFENSENWTPENATSYMAGEMVTLKTGLAHSINRITAYLMKEIGPDAVVELVHKMGIDEDNKIKPVPSICLGSPDLSVFEMVGAYSTFANRGFYSRPLCITRVEDKNGNVIHSFTPAHVEVINEKTAYAMISLLKGVTDFGTGMRIRGRYNLRGEIAGKTGTTNDNSDGWYIGMTPKIVAGAWVGGDEKVIHFRNTKLGGGSNMALPIFGRFMNKVYADTSLHIYQDDRFIIPPNLNIELDCSKYELPPSQPTATFIITAEGDTIVVPIASPAPATDSTMKIPTSPDNYNNQFD
jgi:penicillin-binding protein 1A